MADYGFLSVLEEEMTVNCDYDFAINWDKRRHAVEVSFILQAQNKAGIKTVDAKGNSSGDDILFEDCVLFYNPQKTVFNKEDYLAAIPYEPKKGLSREFLVFFAQFLNDTADKGLDALIDFLENPETQEFFIVWDRQAFAEGRAALEEKEFYPYPRY
ncbi:DUF3013 family protein [Streptococcus pantholopis]|uniref:DUF3013 domain-containing protein n=1 Tax=Streptococcus pantholopis TaxID=1811193 RepID=A0A172Q9Q3_9STRE|nr:DUF3013 family protein [Streptococcus pantholopis]AND80158.1 hypothetical protein A0O21_09170 [Streptococcus pantholopis]